MIPPIEKHEDLSISEYRSVRISYGALVFVVAAIFGAGVWMTTVNIKLDNEAILVDLLDKRLSHMETLMEDLKQQNLTRGRK